MLLKGYTSTYWASAHVTCGKCNCSTQTGWGVKLVALCISLHKKIWDDKNFHAERRTTEIKRIGTGPSEADILVTSSFEQKICKHKDSPDGRLPQTQHNPPSRMFIQHWTPKINIKNLIPTCYARSTNNTAGVLTYIGTSANQVLTYIESCANQTYVPTIDLATGFSTSYNILTNRVKLFFPIIIRLKV